MQILEEAEKYAAAVGLNATCVYGGVSKFHQIKTLQAGVDIVVGTPGRINDLFRDGILNLQNVHYLVLDEADRMLDMGFEPQIRSIVDELPEASKRQTIFFSATWPKEVQLLALDFVTDPVLIMAGDTNTLNANAAIQQQVSVVASHDKEKAFMELVRRLRDESPSKTLSALDNSMSRPKMPKTIVFMARKVECDEMADKLRSEGVPADSIHGDLSQEQRSRTLDRFRRGSVRILVATDVAARGLDVRDVEVVINYDFPLSGLEDYVHRIGRTARGENSGRSYSFLTPQDQRLAKDLITLLQRSKQPVPPELEELANSRGNGKTNSFRSTSRYSDQSGRPRETRPFKNEYSDHRRFESRRPVSIDNEERWREPRKPRASRFNDYASTERDRRQLSPYEDYGRRRSSRRRDEDEDEEL